jgi:hypothetical protein
MMSSGILPPIVAELGQRFENAMASITKGIVIIVVPFKIL